MKKLFSSFASLRKPNTRVKSRRLRIETLEDRQMLDADGLMVADAQGAEAHALLASCEIPVTIADDVVDHSDDFNADGTPNRISLREAFDYIEIDKYDTIVFESSETVYVLNSTIDLNRGVEVHIIGNHNTITTNGKCDAIDLRQVVAASFEDLRFDNCGSIYSEGGAISYEGDDALTIENCQFDNCVSSIGGAIYCNDGLRVKSSAFNNCYATSEGAQSGYSGQGGAIYCRRSTSLNNTTFTGNNAAKGGAIFIDSYNLSISDTTIDNCTFTQNGVSEDTKYGGAIYVARSADTNIICSTFTENGVSSERSEEHNGESVVVKGDFTVRGGAIYSEGRCFIASTEFIGNHGYFGGAIYDKEVVVLQGGVEFSQNEAYLGGAIYAHARGHLTIESGSNKFISNVARFSDSATQTHGSGAAIYVSSGADSGGEATIENAEFIGNEAYKYGGAIANYGTTTTSNCYFEKNVASIGGAVCNADRYISSGDNFTGNGAYCGGDKESSEGHDWFYTAGGNGGAIYSANNATYERGTYLGIDRSATFLNNKASRSGGAINVVSGKIGFRYREEMAFVFGNNLSTYGMGGAIVLANGLDNVEFNVEGGDVRQNHVFVFDDNYAWYAPTIVVAAKIGDEMRRVVEGFGFNYSKLTPDQVDTFTRYDDQLTDGKLTYEYLADLSKRLSPKGAITVCYIGDGSSGEVTIHPGEEVRLGDLGVPTTSAGVMPGSYKLEFYYGDPNSDPDRDPESKTAFELIVGVTGAEDYMMMRRVEIVDYDDPVVVPMTGFSFATYDRPVEAVSIDWGDGSQVWFAEVGSFSTNVYHMFPEKIDWDPKSGASDPNVYTVTADFALVGSTRHITVSFQYHAHASSKDWHVRPGETGAYDAATAALDLAFAELDLFGI